MVEEENEEEEVVVAVVVVLLLQCVTYLQTAVEQREARVSLRTWVLLMAAQPLQ